MDEPAHLGTVLKYAQGEIPRSFDPFTPETIRCVALYSSSFYLGAATNHGEMLPPPWKMPPPEQAAWIAAKTPSSNGTNYENAQPPLYYAVAGACWHLTGWLKFEDGHRLYCLRFLAIPVVFLVVGLGWLVARTVFPDRPFRQLAVPALLAFMPQSAFYSIESDAFSPVFFGAAFLLVLRLFQAESPSAWMGAAAGLCLAATFLVKMTNVPPLIVAAIFVALWTWKLARTGRLRRSLPALTALCACAAVPAAVRAIWCRRTFSDFTGTRILAEYWTWTPKPFTQWWSHPIFTIHGARKFLSLFISQFWQGEFTWHCQPMLLRLPSWIYSLATVALLALALAKTMSAATLDSSAQRRALWFGFFTFASCAAFLAFTSISFNFNKCPIPTPEIPYLTNGRQALGALVPFMLVFVTGLDHALGRLTGQKKFSVLGIILLAMLATEIYTDRRVFADEYNWFHL